MNILTCFSVVYVIKFPVFPCLCIMMVLLPSFNSISPPVLFTQSDVDCEQCVRSSLLVIGRLLFRTDMTYAVDGALNTKNQSVRLCLQVPSVCFCQSVCLSVSWGGSPQDTDRQTDWHGVNGVSGTLQIKGLTKRPSVWLEGGCKALLLTKTTCLSAPEVKKNKQWNQHTREFISARNTSQQRPESPVVTWGCTSGGVYIPLCFLFNPRKRIIVEVAWGVSCNFISGACRRDVRI